MLTLTSPRHCLLVQVDKSGPYSGPPCSFSLRSRCFDRESVLSSHKQSKILRDVVSDSGTGGRQMGSPRFYSKRWSYILRAVQAESLCQLVDKSRPSHEAEAGTAEPAVLTSSLAIQPELGLAQNGLESTIEHRLWLGFGISATVGMITKGMLAVRSGTDDIGVGLGVIAAYILADLGTGIYHWGIDNYGDAQTPIFGSQIDAFQGHHRRPWTITKREFANNTHAIAKPVGFFLVPFFVLPGNPTGDAFLGLFLGLVIMSQQIHSWAHSKRSQLPGAVNFLQEKGILVSRKMHGAHHRAPYNINYCIVSGIWNPILDKWKFFPRLEAAIHSKWGVVPRCWADTVAVEWLQEGSYFEDGSDIKVNRKG